MHVSRLVFWVSASLVAVLLLCILGNLGCGGQPVVQTKQTKKTKTFDCGNEQDITVDLHNKNAVDKQAVYVCDQDQVVWRPAAGVTSFAVHFTGDCPFTSCASDITDSTPQTAATQPKDLTVYKYNLTVNGNLVSDPHVVGGGGY
jgi:hypothetical protein